MKKPGYIFLIFLIILPVFIFNVQAAEINFIKKDKLITELNLDRNIEIIDKRFIDLTGDGIKEQVFLIGQRPAGPDSLFYAPLKVIVYDIYKKEFYVNSYDNFNGYEPQMAFYDFTGDQIKDIFIEANTGGSGGIYKHLIATVLDNDLKIIFNESHNKPLHMAGNYEDNFKTILRINEIDKNLRLDLSFNRNKYVQEGIYNSNGTLQREIQPYTYPFGQLKPVDYDLDQTMELKGIQRIVGAYGADTIGHLETILNYDGSWEILEVQISTYLKKYDPSRSGSNGEVSYKIKQNAITSGIKEIYYPQITDLPKDVNSVYINKQLHDIVKPFLAESNEMSIDYDFTVKNKKLFSVKFSGYQKHEGGQYEILKSFNYDIKNNRRLTLSNILKDETHDKDKVNQIIKDNIEDKDLRDTFPGLSDWMGFYLTNSDLVLYYLRDDFETKFNKIRVPLRKLRQYLSFEVDIQRDETEIFIIEVD
ncbi:MAG TPA: hypothetical protein VKN64_08605 [Halanaerobiales bacterium]|nr:hypothetical protein [Halanaerobiales bacterium]